MAYHVLSSKMSSLPEHGAPLTRLGERYHRSRQQLLARWAIDSNLTVLTLSTSEKHIRDNLGVADFGPLPAEERSSLVVRASEAAPSSSLALAYHPLNTAAVRKAANAPSLFTSLGQGLGQTYYHHAMAASAPPTAGQMSALAADASAADALAADASADCEGRPFASLEAQFRSDGYVIYSPCAFRERTGLMRSAARVTAAIASRAPRRASQNQFATLQDGRKELPLPVHALLC